MAIRLSLIEQETIVTYNAAEDCAEIYTSNYNEKMRFDALVRKAPKYWSVIREDKVGKVYKCPKEFITFRKTMIVSQMTDEQKEAARERMKAVRKARRIKSS